MSGHKSPIDLYIINKLQISYNDMYDKFQKYEFPPDMPLINYTVEIYFRK